MRSLPRAAVPLHSPFRPFPAAFSPLTSPSRPARLTACLPFLSQNELKHKAAEQAAAQEKAAAERAAAEKAAAAKKAAAAAAAVDGDEEDYGEDGGEDAGETESGVEADGEEEMLYAMSPRGREVASSMQSAHEQIRTLLREKEEMFYTRQRRARGLSIPETRTLPLTRVSVAVQRSKTQTHTKAPSSHFRNWSHTAACLGFRSPARTRRQLPRGSQMPCGSQTPSAGQTQTALSSVVVAAAGSRKQTTTSRTTSCAR